MMPDAQVGYGASGVRTVVFEIARVVRGILGVKTLVRAVERLVEFVPNTFDVAV